MRILFITETVPYPLDSGGRIKTFHTLRMLASAHEVRLHAFIREHGEGFDGRQQKHHEIYLGDPRRTAPQRLRTIVRQPVA